MAVLVKLDSHAALNLSYFGALPDSRYSLWRDKNGVFTLTPLTDHFEALSETSDD